MKVYVLRAADGVSIAGVFASRDAARDGMLLHYSVPTLEWMTKAGYDIAQDWVVDKFDLTPDPIALLRRLVDADFFALDDQVCPVHVCHHCRGPIHYRTGPDRFEPEHAADCPYVAAKAFLDGLEGKPHAG